MQGRIEPPQSGCVVRIHAGQCAVRRNVMIRPSTCRSQPPSTRCSCLNSSAKVRARVVTRLDDSEGFKAAERLVFVKQAITRSSSTPERSPLRSFFWVYSTLYKGHQL